jgi:hypothetical protein
VVASLPPKGKRGNRGCFASEAKLWDSEATLTK